MSKSIYISYSSANRYKSCPEKYYLAKQFTTTLITSAFPFGNAIEASVSALLLGQSLEEALEIFRNRWHTEKLQDGTDRQVIDNPKIQFFASDYDYNLFNDEDEKLLDQWLEECKLTQKFINGWNEAFEDIVARTKDGKEVSDNEQCFHNRVIWLCAEVRGQVLVKAFNDKLLPKLKLVSVNGKPATQVSIDVNNEEGDKIIGFMDFVLEHEDYREVIITDLKTSGYPYAEHKLVTSEQLRTYVAAKGNDFNTRRAGYIVLIKKIKVKKKCNVCGAFREGMNKNCKECEKGKYIIPELDGDVQFITHKFEDTDLEDVLKDYQNVTVAVKNEIRYKNPETCMAFGRKCEFYDMCWNKKQITDIPDLEEKKSLPKVDKPDTTEDEE